MPFNLRPKKPKCFYCGSRSAQYISPGRRQFECEHCLAVNHLDENGAITDPPTSSSDSPAPASVRYARPRPVSPQQPMNDVFCDICLKNQHLYKENLALYLPEPHDPRYREYLASLPAYKAKLDERYPQVCAECAPRARERIRQASYVAKTDHIRRMMAGTRAGVMPLRDGAWWRLWVIRFGGLGWYTSAAAQVAWHVLGAVMQSQEQEQLQSTSSAPVDISNCLRRAWKAHESEYSCVTGIAQYLPFLLLGSLLSIWWNPQLSDKYLGRRKGRMVGLADYYVHCIVTLVVRGVAWWLLADWKTFSVRDDMYKAGHLFMIVFIIVTTGFGYTIVKLDTNPLVSFHISDDQILPNVPEKDPNAPPAPRSLRSTQQSLFQPAPTSSLMAIHQPQLGIAGGQAQPSIAQQRSTFQPQSTPQRKQPTAALFSTTPSAAQASTPDPDAMDWSPSHTTNALAAANFRQRAPPHQPISSFSIGPSPFNARVPPAPPNRMRHPLEKAAVASAQPFQKASATQQRNFFREMTESRDQKQKRAIMQQREWDGSEASTVPTVQGGAIEQDDYDTLGVDGGRVERGVANGAGSAGDFKLGPQRLFLKSDDRDTGLESMFDEVFSFQEDADEQSAEGQESQQGVRRGGGVFGLDGAPGTVGRRRSEASGRAGSSGLWSVVLFGMVPAIILGVVAIGVKFWRRELVLDVLTEAQEL